MNTRALLLLSSLSLLACGGDDDAADASAADTGSGDTSADVATDAPEDSNADDVGLEDAGPEDASEEDAGEDSGEDAAPDAPDGPIDITNAEFTNTSPRCADYLGEYFANVRDIGEGRDFMARVEIVEGPMGCVITSNGIPNHDFNATGRFANEAAEVEESFTLVASPEFAEENTPLTIQWDNGVFLNGVKLDLLAAACYGVGPDRLGRERIGCGPAGTPWRYDPMFEESGFGTDGHNAHTQNDGAYHYHGDPNAMYDASGEAESGVIGFAADGFPIYGPFIEEGGEIRRVRSGYTLREGARVSQEGEGAYPGDTFDEDYNGRFIDDYEFTDAGDLDECNGMVRNGSYGYYLTDSYPWILSCFRGEPHMSFRKR